MGVNPFDSAALGRLIERVADSGLKNKKKRIDELNHQPINQSIPERAFMALIKASTEAMTISALADLAVTVFPRSF